ncbi:MAG: MBL fold metallo-hydrolase [Rhizobiales bacterium]|nr:MBL fold metallo-hydrolase [Hyphomicrobiales bacterium]
MLQTALAERPTVPTLPREIAPNTFWFGCCLEVHQPTKIVHNHNSSYLLIGSEATVLVDTGMPYGWVQLREELMAVLDGRPLDYVFPTHPEAPHMGNTGPLLEMYPKLRLAGDLRNYHLYYPHAQDRFQTMQAGESLDLGGRRLMALPAVIHDIPNTLWAYEPDQRILFVSDAYPYTHEHEVGQCGLTAEELPNPVRADDTSVVIGFALGWARHVDADKVMVPLHALLEKYPVDIIGPAHGGVITNPKRLTEIFGQGLRKVRM